MLCRTCRGGGQGSGGVMLSNFLCSESASTKYSLQPATRLMPCKKPIDSVACGLWNSLGALQDKKT